jgi:hypothetical protein
MASTGSVIPVNLRVGLRSVANVQANTRINLAGIGYVVLNEQTRHDSGSYFTSISVNAIHVYVTQRNVLLGLRPGTQIVVGHADTSFSRTKGFFVVGANSYGLYAYGKAATVTLSSGPAAYASVGCLGGSMTNRILQFTISGVGSSGTIVDTASGAVSKNGSSAHAQSKVQSLSLFSKLITAAAIQTDAYARFKGSRGSNSASLTALNLTVGGVRVTTTKTNVRITLSGLGYVIVNERSQTGSARTTGVTINALDVRVTSANRFGLPIGSQIVVGHAHAMASRFS